MASSVPRGRPLGPDTSVRVENGTKDCLLPSYRRVRQGVTVYSVLSPHTEAQTACADAKVTRFLRSQREKDEIRQERPVQYLTQAARVAKLPLELATLEPKMATLGGDFGNPGDPKWQP